MAWVEVAITRDSIDDNVAGTTAVRTFYCRSDSATSVIAALTASHGGTTVTAKGAAFDAARPYCTCKSRKVDRQSPTQFVVTCNFADPSNGQAANETELLALAATITRNPESVMEPYDKDAAGDLVLNTAGEPFDRMPERQAGVGVFIIHKFINAATRTAIEAAWNTTNSGTVSIDGVSIAAGKGWLADYSAEPVDGATGVYEARIIIKYKKSGWNDLVQNYGFCDIFGRITEEDDQGNRRPISTPWPLDDDGIALADRTDVPHESEFLPYEEHAWTGVPLT